MGVSIDISERKRSEEALADSEARLATGAELAGLAFYEVDFSAGTMYSDDRLHGLCGVPPDQVAGLGVLEFWMERLHPDDRPRVMELRRQLHGGDSTSSPSSIATCTRSVASCGSSTWRA